MFRDIAGHEELTSRIIRCAIRVHAEIGPGLFESIYEACLLIELADAGLNAEAGRRLPLTYRGRELDQVYIPDVIVENAVVVEVKAIERLLPVHRAQVVSYLMLTGCPVGLLINFHASTLTAGLRRLTRPDLYRRRSTAARRE
jgi:GxxExxY protein